MVALNVSEHYTGLSTDEKPANPQNGADFYEMDTGKVYMYDKSTDEWREQ